MENQSTLHWEIQIEAEKSYSKKWMEHEGLDTDSIKLGRYMAESDLTENGHEKFKNSSSWWWTAPDLTYAQLGQVL